MRLSVLAVSLTGIFLIIMAAVLWLMIRGRRVPNAPACPSCRYYVRDIEGCLCPECGNDLCSSGVLAGSRIPVARWIRGLFVVLLAVVLFATYARVTFTPFQDLADAIFGRQVDRAGSYAIEIGLQRHASEIDSLRVQVISPASELTNPYLNRDELWNDQMPMEVQVKWHDGRQHVLRLVPVGHDQDGVTQWQLQPGPAMYRFQPSLEDLYPKEVSSQHLNDHVALWMEQANSMNDPWDPAGFVLRRMVAQMQLIHHREQDSTDVHYLLGESAQAQSYSRTGGNMVTFAKSRVSSFWLIWSTWIVLWLIVLILALIPGVRYEAWSAETQSAS